MKHQLCKMTWGNVVAVAVVFLAIISSKSCFCSPVLDSVDVNCGREGMTVVLKFNQSFEGVVYSKGHFYDPECNYVKPVQSGSGEKEFTFLVPFDGCGSIRSAKSNHNTIIIQNDPLIQEIWDVAQRLTCEWKSSFSKSVNSKPINVDNSEKVDVVFDSNTINTVMRIERGKSPFSSPTEGALNIGEDSSIVIYIKDTTQQLDANVVSCSVRSTKSNPVNLVDKNGCVVRPNLMTAFKKERTSRAKGTDILLSSNFKAFRIGDDPSFKLTCQLEICKNSCLDPCVLGPYADLIQSRSKRHIIAYDKSSNELNSVSRNITLEHSTKILAENIDEIQDHHRIEYNTCLMVVIMCGVIIILLLASSIMILCSIRGMQDPRYLRHLEATQGCPKCKNCKGRFVEAFRFRITEDECNGVLAQKDVHLITKIGGKRLPLEKFYKKKSRNNIEQKPFI